MEHIGTTEPGLETPPSLWNETRDPSGEVRPVYRPLFQPLDAMRPSGIRALDDRLEATMREMGVTFDISRERPWGKRPWYCDLLPQIFTPEEWDSLTRGVSQRLQAFEMFLRDIYGKKEILRAGLLPVQPVLGSSAYQLAATGLTPPAGAFLHLSGLCVSRLPNGQLAVKQHYFSNASGISYMIQNRRALARVIPQSFQDISIHSIAGAPVDILETLQSFSSDPDPTIVLLSSGPGSAVYSEHSFLARRMGIPLVQGGDLLMHNDAIYLKTVSGLEKVEVIYNRIADQWLDPMVFRRDSVLGVPGLVHCIRQGTVVVVNSIGSQLADDRALLPLAPTIIRFYLGENPVLPGLTTYWLGDLDQRELVLSNLAAYSIRPLHGEKVLLGGGTRPPSPRILAAVRAKIRENPSQFVAQVLDGDATTISYHKGKKVARRQDHIIFGLRRPQGGYEIFPGALTRTTSNESSHTANELGGGSKDTWVLAPADFVEPSIDRLRLREAPLPAQHVSSRVAEAFYWTGRYLERAHNLAVMIGTIESLEMEELNLTERALYRPVWNRILPPLENPGTISRRNISSAAGRYRLTLDLEEPDSVVQAILRGAGNAESILECVSLETWGVLSTLRSRLQRNRFRPEADPNELTSDTRRFCDMVIKAVPEFFGTAEATMLADGGWVFCEIGQLLERATITGNALCSIVRPMDRRNQSSTEQESEIRLSAFLRLLNSRDVYRRVYQMRIEEAPMLDLLWANPMVPRSVARCLESCARQLQRSKEGNVLTTKNTIAAITRLVTKIRQIDWEELDARSGTRHDSNLLFDEGTALLAATLDIHHLISDGFLNHQIRVHAESGPHQGSPSSGF